MSSSGGLCRVKLRNALLLFNGNHFEKLRGTLAGLYSIRVNNQWRLVFRCAGSGGEAEGVYLDDHSYR